MKEAAGRTIAADRRALERYLEGPAAGSSAALKAKTAGEVVFRIMRFHADAAGHPDRPRRCLLVQGALVCGDENHSIRVALGERRHFAEAALLARLEQAKREGDLPADAKPADLARYVWTVCHGLAVQAVDGATRAQLRRVVQMAMRAWPVFTRQDLAAPPTSTTRRAQGKAPGPSR